MPKTRTLEVTVLRNGRREDRFEVDADPRSPSSLEDVLGQWLRDNKWHKGRWGEFELEARAADSGPKVNVKVRAAA